MTGRRLRNGGLGLAAIGCLMGCQVAPAALDAVRLTWMQDDAAIRILFTPTPPAAGRYRLAVVPNGTQSIQVRLQSGPAQSPALLTADRVVTFDTAGAVGPIDFTKLRPGQYRIIARAYSGTGAGGAQLAERILDQTCTGGATATITLKMRLTPLAGDVGF